MSTRSRPTKKSVKKAMREVFSKEPSTVSRANVSAERKHKMKVAIGLTKARAATARRKKG